jgi:hypothetical protein
MISNGDDLKIIFLSIKKFCPNLFRGNFSSDFNNNWVCPLESGPNSEIIGIILPKNYQNLPGKIKNILKIYTPLTERYSSKIPHS